MRNRFYSLKYRIFFVFCTCVMIPLLLINIVVSKRYEQSLKESTTQVYEMLSNQISTNIDTYLRSIERISLYPYYNEEVQEIIYQSTILENEEADNRENKQVINNFLFNMIIQDSYLRSVFITDLTGEVIYEKSNGGYYRATDYFKTYINSLEAESGIIPTHQQDYVNRSGLEVFSYIRVIKDVNTNTPIGYAILDIDSLAITKIIEQITDVSDEYIMICLEDGSLLSSNLPEQDRVKQQEILMQNVESFDILKSSVVIDGKQCLAAVSDISSRYLITVIYQAEDKVMGQLNQLSDSAVVLVFFISAAVLLISVYAAGKLTMPLQQLRDAMAVVKTGKFDVSVKEMGGHDEVAELTEGFNSMLSSIDHLIKQEYKLILQEREAELKALQNQINPHFLYNTLESIAMMAEINEDPDVADMVTNLGDFLRFSITTKDSTIALGAELEHIDNYLRIQNVRYNNRIHLTVVCSEEFKHCQIVKMSIQPIIENSLLHGYSDLQTPIHIQIIAMKKKSPPSFGRRNVVEENLVITVADNGEGMDEKTLHLVKENMEREQEIYTVKHSIGLRNVHQRLRLKYGDEYGLDFKSSLKSGTTVTIRIPYKEVEGIV